MTDVDPEEVEALTGDADAPKAGVGVVERDFGKPLRLGGARLTAIQRQLEMALFRLGNEVSEALGRVYEVELAGLREVHADVVREGLEEPLAVTRFDAAGQVGWVVWDSASAVLAVERLLCGLAPSNPERALSSLEVDLMAGVVEKLLAACCEAADVEAENHRPVRSLATMGTWVEVGDDADAHRVAFDLVLKTGQEQSELCVYLPGLARGAAAGEEEIRDLPHHLDPIEIELSARLGEVEIPLSDLLALEDGDVIPLGTPTDGTLAVTVDGFEFARGTLGTSAGKLAVRLTEIKEPGSQEPNESEDDQ